MPDIQGGCRNSGTGENEVKQGKKKKGKNYEKKYVEAEKQCAKQKTKNKLLHQELKYREKLHKERVARSKAEAYKEIIEKIVRGKQRSELPEHVIEVDGEVCDG